MTRLRRVLYAFRFIRNQARHGSAALEATVSRRVAETYGLRLPDGALDANLVKRIKARFRNELSFNGDGK